MHVLTVNVETDINSSYAVPIRPRFIRNTEIDAFMVFKLFLISKVCYQY